MKLKLTDKECLHCGHRHRMALQANGTVIKWNCWLCPCKKHIEPTARRLKNSSYKE